MQTCLLLWLMFWQADWSIEPCQDRTHTHTPAISPMCQEARESRGNMSICCCDWQHFSQISPAQPVGSQRESGEEYKREKEICSRSHSGRLTQQRTVSYRACKKFLYTAVLFSMTGNGHQQHANIPGSDALETGTRRAGRWFDSSSL